MHSSASNDELRVLIRAALLKGGAERLDEEVRFVMETLSVVTTEASHSLRQLLARLESGESPYTVLGRYPIPETHRWIAVPVGVMPPGCDTADVIAVIKHIVGRRSPEVIGDIGCGTGVLGLAALIAAPQARGLFLDIDAAACDTTKSNAEQLGVLERCTVIRGDAERGLVGLELDLIVANLPFVPSKKVSSLGVRFRDFAPRLAVDGGCDGLAILRRLENGLHAALRPSGNMVVQFGSEQRNKVLSALGSKWAEYRLDNLHYPNIVVMRRAK